MTRWISSSYVATNAAILILLHFSISTNTVSAVRENEPDYSEYFFAMQSGINKPECIQTCLILHDKISKNSRSGTKIFEIGLIIAKLQQKPKSYKPSDCWKISKNITAYVYLNNTYVDKNLNELDNMTIWSILLSKDNKKHANQIKCNKWPSVEYCKYRMDLKTFLTKCSSEEKHNSEHYYWIRNAENLGVFRLQRKEMGNRDKNGADYNKDDDDIQDDNSEEIDAEENDEQMEVEEVENKEFISDKSQPSVLEIGLGVYLMISVIVIIILCAALYRAKREKRYLRNDYMTPTPQNSPGEETIENSSDYTYILNPMENQTAGNGFRTDSDTPSLSYETVEINTASQQPSVASSDTGRNISVAYSVPNKIQPRNPSKRVLASISDDIVLVDNNVYGAASPEID